MITKKFSKTYDEVLTQSYLFHSEFVADQAIFEAFSGKFASPYADDFLALITVADEIPTNEDDLNVQTSFTNELELMMETCRAQYQKLLLHVSFAWPEDETKQKLFGSTLYGEARKSPSKMVNLLQSSYREANSVAYKASLIAAGFVQADITLLDTLADSLNVKLNEQQAYIRRTYGRTEQRTEAFNAVWDVMTQISGASKLIFKDSPAKIEFYLLYPEGAGPGTLTAPKNFRFFRGSRVFTWDLVENATRYEVEMSLDQIEWIQIFYESWNEIEYDVPDGFSYYRCRAHNSGGFGDFCDVLAIEYYRVLPAPLNFRLELVEGTPKKARCLCDAVPTAELYMTYVSVVNIGASPSDWTGAASNEQPEVLNELVVGKRNYFSMQAQNEGQSSLKTDALYLDVVE